MNYEYDRTLFSEDQQEAIDRAISNDTQKEILDKMTLLNKDGIPVFDSAQMYKIYSFKFYGYPIDKLEIFTKLNKDNKPIYNSGQMEKIIDAIGNLTKEQVEFMVKLDMDDKPIYNEYQMLEIKRGFEKGFSIENVEFYAKLNSNGSPVFNSIMMNAIQLDLERGIDKERIKIYTKLNDKEEPVYPHGVWQMIRDDVLDGYSKEVIDLYAALDKNDKPIFSKSQIEEIRIGLINGLHECKIKLFANPKFTPVQMIAIRNFIVEANDEQFNQIEKCIKEGMRYNKFKILLNTDIPAKNIRILKSIKQLGYSDICVGNLIKRKCDYDELKDIKYFLQCATKLIKKDNGEIYSKLELDELKYSLAHDICANNKINILARETIEKCLEYKMTPEEISFIVNSNFSVDEMRYVSVALLAGASFDEIKENHELAQDVLGDETIPFNFKTDFDIIKEK